jgi:hypothetical protein
MSLLPSSLNAASKPSVQRARVGILLAPHRRFDMEAAEFDQLGRRVPSTPSRSVGRTVLFQQISDLGPLRAAKAGASVPARSRLIAPVIAGGDLV